MLEYIVCALVGFGIGLSVNELMNRALIRSKDELLESKGKLIFAQKKYISVLLEGIELRDRALEEARHDS